MTHDQKLNRILHALLSRQPKRLADKTDDKRLTFEFLCDALFQGEDVVGWEIEFLKDRLLTDSYIEFIEFDDAKLPDLTQEGVKFIQQGGYVEQNQILKLEKEMKL